MIIETIKLYEMSVFSELFLGIGIIYLIMHGMFVSFTNANKFPLITFSIIYLSVLILVMSCFLLINDSLLNLVFTSFCNTITTDYLSFFAKLVIGVASIICLFLIQQYLLNQQINSFEYVVIILFSILGLFLLCSANDLITAYLAVELQSLSFYILSAFKKNSIYSVESGLKYFILGAFSSGLFLFGSSLIYGTSGSLNFEDLKDLVFYENQSFSLKAFFTIKMSELLFISEKVNTANIDMITSCNNLILIGLIFIFISLFFKLALTPFHLWSPDIYEGSPSSSTLFFAIVPKISIFILLLRISHLTFFSFISMWEEYVTIIAVSSIVVGSVVGLEQRKFKSLLAYSSISHMGYLLISFCAGTIEGFQMLFCYLVIYIGSGLCIWSIFMLTSLKTVYDKKQNKDLGDLSFLFKSNSMLAVILATALFSIAGLPPLIGFMVKLSIFLVVIEQSFYITAFISIVFSVISTFFYLRIIKILFFEPKLTGCLYYPINTQKAVIVSILFYLFIYLFINPSMLYLLAYKISLFFF